MEKMNHFSEGQFSELEIRISEQIALLTTNGLANTWENEREFIFETLIAFHVMFGVEGNPFSGILHSNAFYFSEYWKRGSEMGRIRSIEAGYDVQDYYGSLSYTDLKEMIDDSLDQLKYDSLMIVRKMDSVLKLLDSNNEKAGLMVELLRWCTGGFKKRREKRMYDLDYTFIEDIEGGNIEIKKSIDELNNLRRRAATTESNLTIALYLCAGKFEGVDNVFAEARAEIKSNNKSEGLQLQSNSKVGRPKNEVATEEKVNIFAEKYFNDESFIHQNGRYRGNPNWSKIANTMMAKQGWSDDDVGLKTVKRRVKKAFNQP